MLRLEVFGNVGQPAVVRHLENGRKAIGFTVAHSEKWYDRDGVEQVKTTWVDCTIWKEKDESIEVSKWIVSGQKVLVSGIPAINQWRDQKGEPKASMTLNVRYFELGGMSQKAATAAAENTAKGKEGTGGNTQADAAPQGGSSAQTAPNTTAAPAATATPISAVGTMADNAQPDPVTSRLPISEEALASFVPPVEPKDFDVFVPEPGVIDPTGKKDPF